MGGRKIFTVYHPFWELRTAWKPWIKIWIQQQKETVTSRLYFPVFLESLVSYWQICFFRLVCHWWKRLLYQPAAVGLVRWLDYKLYENMMIPTFPEMQKKKKGNKIFLFLGEGGGWRGWGKRSIKGISISWNKLGERCKWTSAYIHS